VLVVLVVMVTLTVMLPHERLLVAPPVSQVQPSLTLQRQVV
jgi:hypothetical protein